jgi:hypothetical protein
LRRRSCPFPVARGFSCEIQHCFAFTAIGIWGEGPGLGRRATESRISLSQKTASAGAGESVLVVGLPVDALRPWLALSKIDAGPVFRRIDQWGSLGAGALRQCDDQTPLRRRRS